MSAWSFPVFYLVGVVVATERKGRSILQVSLSLTTDSSSLLVMPKHSIWTPSGPLFFKVGTTIPFPRGTATDLNATLNRCVNNTTPVVSQPFMFHILAVTWSTWAVGVKFVSRRLLLQALLSNPKCLWSTSRSLRSSPDPLVTRVAPTMSTDVPQEHYGVRTEAKYSNQPCVVQAQTTAFVPGAWICIFGI